MGTILIPRRRRIKKNQLRERIVHELDMDSWDKPVSMEKSNEFSIESLQTIASALEIEEADDLQKQQEIINEEFDKTGYTSEVYGLGINILQDVYAELLYKKGLMDNRVFNQVKNRHSD